MPAKTVQFTPQSIRLIKDLARKYKYDIEVYANKTGIVLSMGTHITHDLERISTTYIFSYEDGVNKATTSVDLLSYEESDIPAHDDDTVLLDNAVYTFRIEDISKFFSYLKKINDKYIDRAYSEFY